MRYPKGCQTTTKTADGSVYSGVKNVYALIIAANGATIGDKVTLKATGAAGTVIVYTVVGISTGTQIVDLGRWGVEIADCYYDTSLAVAGKIYTTIIHS